MVSLSHIAAEYQTLSGCDDATAQQAAFVAATLLADMVGHRDIGDYFAERAEKVQESIEFSGFKTESDLIDTSYRREENWGWYS